MKDQVAKELIRNGVPMARKVGGDWIPATVRHSGHLTKLNGQVVRQSLVTQARCYGLVA